MASLVQVLGQGELFALFRRQMELCKVKSGERVLVVYDAGTRQGYVEATVGALVSLGASAIPLALPGISMSSLASPNRRPVLSETALAAAGDGAASAFTGNSPSAASVGAMIDTIDMVIDLAILQHSPGRVEALAAGKRMLTIVEPPEVLERLFPTPELKEQCKIALELLLSAKEMRVTSAAGTDLVAEVDVQKAGCQYGYVEEPGQWDNWPSGFLAAFAKPGSAEGRIVVDKGDIVCQFSRYVEQPVHFTIADGYITRVEGDGLDAQLLNDYLYSWDDPESLAVSHIGWGMNPDARWEALLFYPTGDTTAQDGRAFLGNFMWSTGPRPYVSRFVPGHLDIPMRACSLALDGETIIEAGKLVHPRLVNSGSLVK